MWAGVVEPQIDLLATCQFPQMLLCLLPTPRDRTHAEQTHRLTILQLHTIRGQHLLNSMQ